MQDSGDDQGEDDRRNERNSDADAALGCSAREVAALQPALCDANRKHDEGQSKSVEKRLQNQSPGRDLKTFAEEVEGDEKRGEEAYRMKVFMRGPEWSCAP